MIILIFIVVLMALVFAAHLVGFFLQKKTQGSVSKWFILTTIMSLLTLILSVLALILKCFGL